MDAFEGARKSAEAALCQTVVGALRKKGYEAVFVPDRDSAAREVLQRIPAGSSVGIPGTVTVRELGVVDTLKQRGCAVYQHWDPSLTPEERVQVMRDENSADYFLTSCNAMTWDGMLVSIDGNGNRVSGMAWSTNTLIFVVGVNKIARTLEEAIERARTATPPNALRLNVDVPCTKTGHCVDCDASSRLCRALLILERPTTGRRSVVIVVGEQLGY